METKNIGIKVKQPSKTCEDKKCPFHGNVKLRKRIFTGVIIAKDTHKTATVEWTYKLFIPKYERHETRRTRVHVHNPPCIDAKIGDVVRIAQTRPLSKTKNFVIIKDIGKERGFAAQLEAEEEAKAVIEKKEKKEKESEEAKEEGK